MSAPIAHAGGWDELLIFLAPIAVYLLVRPFIRRRKDDDPNDLEQTNDPDAP